MHGKIVNKVNVRNSMATREYTQFKRKYKKNDKIVVVINWLLVTLVIIIIIKTSSTGHSGENKVVYKLLSQPHKHLRHGKQKKTQLREATKG